MGPIEQVLEAWSRVRGWYPVNIDGSLYHCDPDHISFWSKISKGCWEPETFAALKRLLVADSSYCDIGAWIGPTVLYAAKICKNVYCIEPDRVAFMYLLQNIKLNHLENVLPFHLALSGEKDAICRMASPRGRRGDSMTSMLRADGVSGVEVLCLRWQTWLDLAGKPKIGCIKMDIEGAEFALLPEMKDYLAAHKPGLFVSLHPHLLPKDERALGMSRVVEVLQLYDNCYDNYGKRVKILSLMEEQVLNRAGSYLLLP
jgi:FkbM family methyltransferase